MRERDAILDLWRAAQSRGEQAILATVCEVKGSAYRRPGARMLLTSGGLSAGVISGGCIDPDLWRSARETMAAAEPRLLTYDSTSPGDIVWGLGLGCRGHVSILLEPVSTLDWLADGHTVATFFDGPRLGTFPTQAAPSDHPRIAEIDGARALVETLQPPPPLWIFGAGADTIPLAAIASSLGWQVWVIDLRPPHPDRFAHLPAHHIAPESLSNLEIDPRAACVVMTHNFLHDLDLLRFLIPSPARYIGVLGPRARTDDLLAALLKEGQPPPSAAQLARLHAPVGLDIGAETPEEIALAILAEIHASNTGRTGAPLRTRAGAIHQQHQDKVGLVLLAAGGSSRLGEPKQLLPFNGASLLRRAAEAALASHCRPVAVVLGAHSARVRSELDGLPVRIVENDHWNTGLSTSVRAGLKSLQTEVEALVFLPCDQPAVDAGTLNKLLAAHRKSSRPIIVSQYGDTWGAPMLITRRYWDELRALHGDRGAQSIAFRHAGEVEAVPFSGGAFDIDTPEDYQALLTASAHPSPDHNHTPAEPLLEPTNHE
jgi:xanthine/CO dehydrogenase XdhC/CoxF family maturation factor/CTP:molybdopterin cytidylyltransferase MocA